MAKPMSPAQIAAIAKTTLINSISIPLSRETAAFIAARGVQRSAPRDSPRPARSRLHHRHHRVGFLVVDDIGTRERIRAYVASRTFTRECGSRGGKRHDTGEQQRLDDSFAAMHLRHFRSPCVNERVSEVGGLASPGSGNASPRDSRHGWAVLT